MRCDECRYYDTSKVGLENAGHCRRYPPKINGASGGHVKRSQLVDFYSTSWPIVTCSEFCGEFHSRSVAPGLGSDGQVGTETGGGPST